MGFWVRIAVLAEEPSGEIKDLEDLQVWVVWLGQITGLVFPYALEDKFNNFPNSQGPFKETTVIFIFSKPPRKLEGPGRQHFKQYHS